MRLPLKSFFRSACIGMHSSMIQKATSLNGSRLKQKNSTASKAASLV
nr:MAG TPA: hypothetical protein [Caudoviricetes sp.]